MKTIKTLHEQKLLNLLKVAHNLDLSLQHQLTNHRKIPSSKYSGRYIIFWEDVSAPLNNLSWTDDISEDIIIEPP